MRTSRTRSLLLALIATTVVLAIAGIALAGPDRSTTLRVDVAENGFDFVWDEDPVFDDGLPAYGNAFVTQGYIYEAGTLTGTDGINPDGSPEFPANVVGTWTCYGYFVGDGGHTEEGAWVVTAQIFEFTSDTVGGHTIVTQGFETPQLAGPAVRAVVGGTGKYSSVRGDVTQITLGHNASDGIDASFSFDLDNVGR